MWMSQDSRAARKSTATPGRSYKEPIDPRIEARSFRTRRMAYTSLTALTTLVTSGSRGWAAHYADAGPLFIRAQNINTDRLALDDIAHVQPPDSAEGRRTQVRYGDLLVTITGANVTKTGVVDQELGEAYVSQHVGYPVRSIRNVSLLASLAHQSAAWSAQAGR